MGEAGPLYDIARARRKAGKACETLVKKTNEEDSA